MLPDVVHFAIALLLVGSLIRIAEYTLATKYPNSPLFKFLTFAY